MTATELATEYGVKVTTIRAWVRRGILHATALKGRAGYRFSPTQARKDIALHFGNAAERDLARKSR